MAVKETYLPLFYIYDSYRISPVQWRRLFAPKGDLTIRRSAEDAIILGLVVETKHRFDIVKSNMNGFYTYFASNGFSYGSAWKNWAELSRFSRKKSLLFSPSVGPGYDDRKIRSWNVGASKDRRDGAYYETAWRTAINCNPDFISVTSFNEWGEGTQVEPAIPRNIFNESISYLDYSPRSPDYYLRLTAQWAKKMKSSTPHN